MIYYTEAGYLIIWAVVESFSYSESKPPEDTNLAKNLGIFE
jgi:hypothetical protein